MVALMDLELSRRLIVLRSRGGSDKIDSAMLRDGDVTSETGVEPQLTSGPETESQLLNSVLERVVVIGTSCAGKTTFANQLSRALDAPNIELDAIQWMPNWNPRPLADLRSMVGEAVAPERWVADGNYKRVRDIVWQRATCLVWLNYPFRVVFWRALRRTFERVFTRQSLRPENREAFRMAFWSKESVPWGVITTFRQRRREFRSIMAQHHFSMLRIIEFRSQREADDFMADLTKLGGH